MSEPSNAPANTNTDSLDPPLTRRRWVRCLRSLLLCSESPADCPSLQVDTVLFAPARRRPVAASAAAASIAAVWRAEYALCRAGAYTAAVHVYLVDGDPEQAGGANTCG